MLLRFLALCDLHLGEDTSILSFPHGRQHLWTVLRSQFGSGKEFEVEELLLLGDIPDRTLSSTSQMITHTNAFIQTLGSAANIKKGIYVPGNHDHTLWRDYYKRCYGKEYGSIKQLTGDLVVKQGERCDEKDSATELLFIFFGYPAGSSWRAIQKEKNFDFAIANPLYATRFNGRTYVFTHGTHFRKDVTLPEWIKKVAGYLELDKAFGKIKLESGGDVTKAKDLEDLEKIVSPFVDSLWPSSKNNPTSRSDQFWYLLTTLSSKFGNKREAPEESSLFSYSKLSKECPSRIKQLTSNDKFDDSIERWRKYFLPHMLGYLKKNELPLDNVTFVYGDTHDGGWGELPLDRGGHIRIYNCGGWVVHNKQDHPACHIFAVDENGEEYILDISYKNVKVEEDFLLELAAQDAENRQENTSRVLRFLLKLLPIG